jgi:hypothetical protein
MGFSPEHRHDVLTDLPQSKEIAHAHPLPARAAVATGRTRRHRHHGPVLDDGM